MISSYYSYNIHNNMFLLVTHYPDFLITSCIHAFENYVQPSIPLSRFSYHILHSRFWELRSAQYPIIQIFLSNPAFMLLRTTFSLLQRRLYQTQISNSHWSVGAKVKPCLEQKGSRIWARAGKRRKHHWNRKPKSWTRCRIFADLSSLFWNLIDA